MERRGACAAALGLALALALSACAGDPARQPGGRFTFENGIGRAADGPFMAQFGTVTGGYSRANSSNWWGAANTVDSFSRLDEIFSASISRRGDAAMPLRRAASEPSIAYDRPTHIGGGHYSLERYLAANPATGLMIVRDGEILVERYQYDRGPAHRLTSFSMAKTLIALTMGVAVAEGHIRSIEDKAETYAPSLAGTEYGRTPIRHLLTMSSGVAFREDYTGDDDVAKLSRASYGGGTPGGVAVVRQFDSRHAEPGQRWHYASSETFVLAMVLKQAVGRPVADYFAEKIWRPIGAEADATWMVDRSGQEVGYMGFQAVLRDYARLGVMLANGGRVGDRQIIPAAWLAETTRAHFSAQQVGRGYGYGFQTWIFPANDGSYALLGVRGQTLFVDPARRLVMVHTAVRPSARDPGGAETVALWLSIKGQYARIARAN
ncbi:MAG: serine hydrolase [Alphaproteobacteria bacterium]|nr:serine hydrolase [Alphaproteobacteria bacterium]